MFWASDVLLSIRFYPGSGCLGVLAARQGVVLSSQWMVWSCGWLVRGRFIQQMGILGAECP